HGAAGEHPGTLAGPGDLLLDLDLRQLDVRAHQLVEVVGDPAQQLADRGIRLDRFGGVVAGVDGVLRRCRATGGGGGADRVGHGRTAGVSWSGNVPPDAGEVAAPPGSEPLLAARWAG